MTRRNKYGAKAVYVDGHRFDSQMEARRYGQLKLLEKAGEIVGLKLQPVFPIYINDQEVFEYHGDFAYLDTATCKSVIEDVKGMRTAVYKLKKKCVEAYYDIEIKEVKA